MIILVPQSSVEGLERFESEQDIILLGREEGDLLLEDDTVSGLHARITFDGERYSMEDLHSTNGTYLNSRRISHDLLENGDVITIGSISLQFYTDTISTRQTTKPTATLYHFDNYEVIEEIARGGMSRIYLATDMTDGKPVVIKVPALDGRRDELILEKFSNEIRIGLHLKPSMNVVKTLDYGEANGLPYLVLEYLHGVTLREVLMNTKNPLSNSYIVDVMRGALTGLYDIHNQGVIHCDFKVENILISLEHGVKIFDFGVSEFAAEAKGQHHGTPYIMSPEQCRIGSIDQRSDIYSIGVILYELATKKVPFGFGSDSELLHAHANLTPTAPSASWSAVSKDIERIILKSLSKKPIDRYQNPLTLLDELEKIKQNSTAEADYALTESLYSQTEANNKEQNNDYTDSQEAGVLINNFNNIELEFIEGVLHGSRYLLSPGVRCVLGRDSEADITVPDEYLSRHHTAIIVTDDSVFVEDLVSSNGTWIENEAVKGQYQLVSDTTIRFGSSALIVRFV